MTRYFRIQPKGLELTGHYSMTSDDTPADGLHVFEGPAQLVGADVPMELYGDEVVVIEAEEDWDNEDVEGCCIDPETAQIVARYTLPEFLALYFPGLPERPTGRDYDECLVDDWETL